MLPGMCRFYVSGSQSRIPSQRRRFDRRRLQKTRTRKKLSPNESQIHQKRQMCRLQMIERKSRQYIRLVDWCVLQLRLKTSQIDQLQLLASLLHKLCVCEMLTSSYTITTKCNGRLKAAHAMIDDNRYTIQQDVALLASSGLDLLDQLWYDAIASAVRELSVF